MGTFRRSALTLLVALGIGTSLIPAVSFLPPSGLVGHVVLAQRFSPDGVWQQVYEKLPNFPRENQYVNRQSGKVSPDNTLVGRLIRYHVYVKNRSPAFRLDWKLTLADYLGVNEPIEELGYPGRELRQSPRDGDIAAIQKLTRSQRDVLVQVLVDLFNGQTRPGRAIAPANPAPAAPTTPTKTPGAADLLRP